MKIGKIESIEEPPLWLTALTRAQNKEHLQGNKGDIWVCGLDSEQPWCKETTCKYCNRVCYYMPDNEDLVKKNAKKVCPQCALDKRSDDLADNMKELLRKVVEKYGNEKIEEM